MKRVALFAAVIALAVPVFAAPSTRVDDEVEALFGSAETLGPAFDGLARAVLSDDRETVAALVKYPLRIELGNSKLIVEDPEEFVRRYSQIVNARIAEAIEEQDYADLRVDAEGVHYRDDAVMLTQICLEKGCDRSYWVIGGLDPQ